MPRIVTVTDQKYAPQFCEWLNDRFDHNHRPADPRDTHTIASVLWDEEAGTFDVLGVTALNRWTQSSCEAHAASDGSKRQKINREYIWTVYDYVFNHAGKSNLITFVSTENAKSLALQDLLGLERIGLVRSYYGEGKDAFLFSISKTQWLAGKWGSLQPELEQGQ